MRSASSMAAAFLALGFAVVSFIAIAIEPAMGFATFADFFDSAKVAAGYGSAAWRLENLIYFGFSAALLVLVVRSHRRYEAVPGLVAAVLFLLLASVDRVGIQLPALLPTEDALRASIAAALPVRFAVLKSAVVALGFFAWSTTRTPRGTGLGQVRASGRGIWTAAWRALGWLVLALSLVFLFAFVPVPLAFFVWAVGLTVARARPEREAAGARPAPEPAAP